MRDSVETSLLLQHRAKVPVQMLHLSSLCNSYAYNNNNNNNKEKMLFFSGCIDVLDFKYFPRK